MLAQTRPAAVTFAVHDVAPATDRLPTCKTHEAIRQRSNGPIESCCDYSADCVALVRCHPLLAAVHLAFSQHRPLVLSPDMIWITIAQGVAQHVANHSEALRPLMVHHHHHQGKLEITVVRRDFIPGSPENPWPEVFSTFSEAIRQHSNEDVHRLFLADFSTTGAVERAVSEVVLMDAFQPYFLFALWCVCGIPGITLEGTVDDWRHLRVKIEGLKRFGLDEWLEHLRPICDQFEFAAEGDVDLPHWRNIYKLEQAYGGDLINGWIGQLFPYVRNERTGSFTEPNPLLHRPPTGLRSTEFPAGLSQVPFTLSASKSGETIHRAMHFLAGTVGVTQDEHSGALRPKLGWAVRQAPRLDQLLLACRRDHQLEPPLAVDAFAKAVACAGSQNPDDFLRFYKACNGGSLFGSVYRFRPLDQVGTPLPVMRLYEHTFPGHKLIQLCDFADGAVACTDLHWHYQDSERYDVLLYEGQQGKAEVPIIATSLTDLLERILGSEGRLFYREPRFQPLGTASIGPPRTGEPAPAKRRKKK
jgi:hypothetical protein